MQHPARPAPAHRRRGVQPAGRAAWSSPCCWLWQHHGPGRRGRQPRIRGKPGEPGPDGVRLDLARRRSTRLLAASALVLGVGGGMLAASSAGAATCDNTTITPSCSTSVTFRVVSGALGVTAPPSQSWSTTLKGTDQELVDTADASFTVQDITGSGGGWTVTATATQFTGAGADGNTLPATGTLVYAGSGTDEASGTIPGAACAPATACVVPTTAGLTLPAPVRQNGTTLVNLFDAEANTGMGTIVVGALSGGAPAAWWVNVPAGATADTYSSVITLAVSTGPVAT
jgi:hypothetical protein